eukprot:757381-Hanusia_phi.AAC.10
MQGKQMMELEDVPAQTSEVLIGNNLPSSPGEVSPAPNQDPPNPGCIGKLFFTWMDSIIRLGHQRNKKSENLEASDLLPLQKQFQAESIRQEVEMLWQEERLRPNPSLPRVLWKKTRGLLLLSALFELFRLVGSFSSPLLVKQIIIYIQFISSERRERSKDGVRPHHVHGHRHHPGCPRQVARVPQSPCRGFGGECCNYGLGRDAVREGRKRRMGEGRRGERRGVRRGEGRDDERRGEEGRGVRSGEGREGERRGVRTEGKEGEGRGERIYSKCLRLSNSARQERSTGEIVNLMSTDAERMFQSFLSFNAAWSAPVQLVLALYLIYVEVASPSAPLDGPRIVLRASSLPVPSSLLPPPSSLLLPSSPCVKDATWIALGGLFFVFFALAVIFMRIMKLEGLRMKAADARVKLLNEMVQGIKVIKLMAWEDPMLLECDRRREVELRHVRDLAITKAMMIATVVLPPPSLLLARRLRGPHSPYLSSQPPPFPPSPPLSLQRFYPQLPSSVQRFLPP